MTYDARARRKKVDGEYRRRYDLARSRGIPTNPLPANNYAPKIKALYDLGWSYEAISHMAGTSDSALLLIANGTNRVVHRSTARALNTIPVNLAPTDAVPDTCLIPSLGATRRVQALLRLGWRHDDMRPIAGVDTSHFARQTYQQTLARKWRAIDNLYEQLSMTQGPSGKTRTYARNAGFAPPLSWIDIDDPAENPRVNVRVGGKGRGRADIDPVVVDELLDGRRVDSTKTEKQEAMRRWKAMGRSERSLCATHGWHEGRYVTRSDDEEQAS